MQERSLNIAIAVPRLEVGGLETVLKSLARHFAAAGHSPTFIETQSKGVWSDEFRALKFSVVTLPASKLTSAASHAAKVGRELRKYDVVLLNDAPHAQGALGLMRETSVAIPILHLPIDSFRRNATANAGEWEVIVSVSPGMREALMVMNGIPANRVICIPNGVAVPPEWPKHKHDFSPSLPLRIIYVGRLEDQQKGVMHLPGIAKRLRDSHVDFEMRIVGDGPHLSSLKQRFAQQCADCRVFLHGAAHHEEVPGLLAKHDVLVLPSYFEGLPIALLEAMAAGVVPVCSRLRGQTDFIISNGENGYLANVGDEGGFAAAIESVAGNRNQLRNLSLAAWTTIGDRFSLEAMGKAYQDTISATMARRATGSSGTRSGRIDRSILGDMPSLPAFLVRPVRRVMRLVGFWPHPPCTQGSMREWAAALTAKKEPFPTDRNLSA